MNGTALSSAKTQRQRGLLSRLFLKPMTIGLVVSFMAGVGVIGWLKSGQGEAVSAPVQIASYQLSIPQMQQAQAPVGAGVQVFDYRDSGRGSGHGVSGSPRQMPQVAAIISPELPAPDTVEEVIAPQDIMPAAGPVTSAASVGAVVTHSRPLSTGRARIAIVIDDLGPNYRESLSAIDLPKEITLAFLPYAEQLATLTSRARAAGHEMLVHMPMEPEDMAHNNPGPAPLTLALTPEEISQRVNAALDSFVGHVGLNNHMGSRFTADAPAMQAMMSELAKRNLLFFDSRTTPRSVGIEVAAGLGMRFAGRDVFLDNEIDEDLIMAQLNTLERLARAQGHASAIGHPYPETIAAIKAWLPGARERGVELVPISALTQRLGVVAVTAGTE